VKLLYDAYHMQIMEGDPIRTIRDNIQYIAHEFAPTRDPLTSLAASRPTPRGLVAMKQGPI
jgi:hypothetical protein